MQPIRLIINGKELVYATETVRGVSQHTVHENGQQIISHITSQGFRSWAAENIEWEVRYGDGTRTVVSGSVDVTS